MHRARRGGGRNAGSATAELAWTLALASRRHLVDEVLRLRQGLWQGHLGRQLGGQRLGVWSYGRVGRQVAAYGRVFGMKVWVWGRAGSTGAARADGFELAPSREAFFARSDVTSLHVRLNPETTGSVTAADLDRMKSSALLVNTSRAELIEAGALEKALVRGRGLLRSTSTSRRRCRARAIRCSGCRTRSARRISAMSRRTTTSAISASPSTTSIALQAAR